MNPTIEELTAAVEREARKRPEALQLMTHPGVGPLTALAYVLITGTPTRFPHGKQIGTYVGMIPCEDSSAGKQRYYHHDRTHLGLAKDTPAGRAREIRSVGETRRAAPSLCGGSVTQEQ